MIRGKIKGALRLLERLVGQPGPIILMYHSVADLDADPWDLAVSPANFHAQIEMLSRTRRVVDLAQIQDQPATRPGEKRPAAITFDDGYRNVLTAAGPVLAKFDCPATIFLTTGKIGSNREFWWDDLSRMILETPLPPVLEFDLAGRKHRIEIGDNPGSGKRNNIHQSIWQALQPLEPATRQEALDSMAAILGCDLSPRSTHAIMNRQDVLALDNTPISVGAHTVTHCFLPAFDPQQQSREIIQSRDDCRDMTGKTPKTFAYPFGNYDESSTEIVRAAGFQLAVTTENDKIRSYHDAMLLPRARTSNWSAAGLWCRLP